MRRAVIVFCLILAAGNIFAAGKIASSGRAASGNDSLAAPDASLPHVSSAPEPEFPVEISRAEKVMNALYAAYPHRIEKMSFRNDDWAILMQDTWYYYAEGKLLPENLLENAENYNRQQFYTYNADLPPWEKPSDEQAARYRNFANNRSSNRLQRSSHFFDNLYQARNRIEAYQMVKSVRFFGKTVVVHTSLIKPLSMVEARIRSEAKTDPKVQAWINGINTMGGWNWRNIADLQSRSHHAYGAAVDILPKSLGGKETYWLWASRTRTEWWNISYNERYHPPEAVVKAFEAYGFIWGGKWLLFDTMHFEYRPEIFILNDIKLETLSHFSS